MATFSIGRAPWRVIAIQVGILLGLAIFLKLYLPHRARALATQAAAVREQRIDALFQDSVEEDSSREVTVPLDGVMVKRHPQRLRTTFSPQDAESTVGVPDTSMTDLRGGQHLTWIGTAHKLEAAFDVGRLYCLTFEDRSTGHGVLVYESPDSWRPY